MTNGSNLNVYQGTAVCLFLCFLDCILNTQRFPQGMSKAVVPEVC